MNFSLFDWLSNQVLIVPWKGDKKKQLVEIFISTNFCNNEFSFVFFCLSNSICFSFSDLFRNLSKLQQKKTNRKKTSLKTFLSRISEPIENQELFSENEKSSHDLLRLTTFLMGLFKLDLSFVSWKFSFSNGQRMRTDSQPAIVYVIVKTVWCISISLFKLRCKNTDSIRFCFYLFGQAQNLPQSVVSCVNSICASFQSTNYVLYCLKDRRL